MTLPSPSLPHPSQGHSEKFTITATSSFSQPHPFHHSSQPAKTPVHTLASLLTHKHAITFMGAPKPVWLSSASSVGFCTGLSRVAGYLTPVIFNTHSIRLQHLTVPFPQDFHLPQKLLSKHIPAHHCSQLLPELSCSLQIIKVRLYVCMYV